MKDRQLVGQGPRHDIRGHGSQECRAKDHRAEVALDFFQDKCQACQRGIERRGQSGPGSRGNQCLAFARRHREPFRHGGPDRAPHLHGGAFPPECQPTSDREHPSDELDGEDASPAERAQPVQDGLQVGNPAACGFRSQAVDQVDRETSPRRAEEGGQQPAPGWVSMRPRHQPVSDTVPAGECPPERHRQCPRQQSYEDGAGEDLSPLLLRPEKIALFRTPVLASDLLVF